MEWSTGLDEDAAESSETLEERSMKKSGVVSLSSFSSPWSSSSLVTSFFCQHNTYMYYYLYVIVLSCILRIHFLLLGESTAKSSSSRKNKLISQPFRSSLPFIAYPGRHHFYQGWGYPVTDKSPSSVFNTSTKTTAPLLKDSRKDPLSPKTSKPCLAAPAKRVVGTTFQPQRSPQKQQSRQQLDSVAAAPGSVSILLSAAEQVSSARSTATTAQTTLPLSVACCSGHFRLSKHPTNNITANHRHHFRKHQQGQNCMTTASHPSNSVRGGITAVDSSRKPCQRIIIASGRDEDEEKLLLPFDTTVAVTSVKVAIIVVRKMMIRMCALFQTFENIQLKTTTIYDEDIIRQIVTRMTTASSLFT